MTTYSDVINFWFEKIGPESWWKKDEAFDQMIRERFTDVYEQAANCELFEWRQDALGWLAEIIVLDQFPRNMFRDSAQAFATDHMAVILVQEAVANQVDRELTDPQKSFLYMPLMHSESALIHETAMDYLVSQGWNSTWNLRRNTRRSLIALVVTHIAMLFWGEHLQMRKWNF